MNIPLDEVVHADFVTSSPATQAASDADSTPTFEVFEEATDTDIGVGGNATKRTSKTGNYRLTFTASAANGFEVGKWYNVVASATVGGIAGKAVVKNFRLVAAEAIAGKAKVDVDGWLGTAAATPTVAGVPEVDITHAGGNVASPVTPATAPTNFGAMVINASGHVTLADASLVTAKLGTFVLAKTTNISGFNDIAATAVVSSGAITTSGGAVSTVTAVTGLTTTTIRDAILDRVLAGNHAVTGTPGGLLQQIADIDSNIGLVVIPAVDKIEDIRVKTAGLTFTTAGRVDSQVFGLQAGVVDANAMATNAIGSLELSDAAASKIADAVDLAAGVGDATAANQLIMLKLLRAKR